MGTYLSKKVPLCLYRNGCGIVTTCLGTCCFGCSVCLLNKSCTNGIQEMIALSGPPAEDKMEMQLLFRHNKPGGIIDKRYHYNQVKARSRRDNLQTYACYVIPNQDEEEVESHPPFEMHFTFTKDAQFTAFVAHGKDDISYPTKEELDFFRLLKCNVVLFEYPGYGHDNTCSPTEEGAIRHAKVAYDVLLDVMKDKKEFTVEKIIFCGISIGTSIITGLAAKLSPNENPCILMFAPPTTIRQAIRDFPLFRPKTKSICASCCNGMVSSVVGCILNCYSFSDGQFNNVARVERLQNRILVIHGKKDRLIPCRHGEQVAQAARNAALYINENMGHGENVFGPDNMHIVSEFINRSGPVFKLNGLMDIRYNSIVEMGSQMERNVIQIHNDREPIPIPS